MQKLQDSVFSIIKTTNLSPAVFNFLQPSDDSADKSPIGGILKDTKHGWLALGPRFCVVDLRSGLKVAARIFGSAASSSYIHVTSVVELPTPLTPHSQQLIISLQYEDTGLICVLHINGSQILRCIQTEAVITELSVCDMIPDGPLSCFDGLLMAGTKNGEILVFDLNRANLLQALKDISQGYEHLLRSELTPANLVFLPLNALRQIEGQRELALENDDHLALLLNESSFIEDQYIFRNPDETVRMKAKRDHIRVTVVEYIPQLGSLAVGYNFGAFQIWNMLNLELEFTSQVNVECLPVTHFGFQEPCDDPRAFCYLWVIFSVIDRFEEEEFPLAVMYSLTYQGKRMLSDTKCLYQEFSNATIRFQLELGGADENSLLGGKCISCNTYSVNSTLGAEGEDSMLNICQLVWECWGENANFSTQYGMLLFDLDQWYKDQMPATYRLESNAFMSTTWCSELGNGSNTSLDVRLDPNSVSVYCHATRLEEHFYPNSLQYNVIAMSACGAAVLGTAGIQRQLVSSLDACGPGALLRPRALHAACVAAGLAPAHAHAHAPAHPARHDEPDQDEQRRFLLSVALEARLSRFLKRCAHDWATGSHSGAGCTLTFLVDWCWTRAIELKENAKELTAPLFVSSALPDRNVVRCLEHCVQQLTQLTGLLDAVLTKCCNLVVPDALSEMEEKYKGIGTVSLYFQVVQWFLRVGLLPERRDGYHALPFPHRQLAAVYNKRRLKLNRLQDSAASDENSVKKPCSLLYIDQLIEHEFGGDRIHQLWIKGGSECHGLYPPPSLYSLLRLYLLPEIAEEHKHSLVLYLLVDYSMVYDDVRYEAVIRRLMQFPTMFGLSNTAIKATQAFWHLDHRDFDFALDQLQCLTGNTLSGWQHHVVLSSLLAQKKTQAALQYLHVRKPAPVHSKDTQWSSKGGNQDKLEDWQSCCSLYLARSLVFEALDVVRACMNSARTTDDKVQVLNFFFKDCRSTGNLAKILQVTLQQFEEEVFIKYLKNCNDPQASDILIMYYLQRARYIEAQQYNSTLRPAPAPLARSLTSLAEAEAEAEDAEEAGASASAARDHMVRVACAALPAAARAAAAAAAAACALHGAAAPHAHAQVVAPKPMSVYVQAKSPTNTFTYKSSFIQDTIENASETWMNRPKMRKGIKRALDIEETPFICTPKLIRTRSIFTTERESEAESPPKRAKLSGGAARAAGAGPGGAAGAAGVSRAVAALLHVPELCARGAHAHAHAHADRGGAGTPHSILKTRRNGDRDAPSPVDSRYLGDSDDELLETASNHTHCSDSTNKHLRFTIPTASESGSTPSPTQANALAQHRREPLRKSERTATPTLEQEIDISSDSYTTSTSRFVSDKSRVLESPPKGAVAEQTAKPKKTYKDNVRARHTLSISANSSLTDTSMESIADIPITLINPRYSGEKGRQRSVERDANSSIDITEEREGEIEEYTREKVTERPPATPKGRRSIRSVGESTPLANRSQTSTPDRQDSPVVTPLRRTNRSRSRTPELASIPEQPRQLRSRSRTPERLDKSVIESPKLAPICESPTKSLSTDSPPTSPSRRSLRSRSRTPEVPEPDAAEASPRSLRSRLKTPEKVMSPKMPQSARRKPLSRQVLEAIAFAKAKQGMKTSEDSNISCTPVKTNQVPSLLDVSLSPIVNKSVLQSSEDSMLSETVEHNADKSQTGLKSLPAFTTIQETFVEKSVLRSYHSSVADPSLTEEDTTETIEDANISNKQPKAVLITINETETRKSVLRSYDSSIAETSSIVEEPKVEEPKPFAAFSKMIESDYEKSVLRSYQSDANNEPSSLMTNDSDESEQEGSKDSAVIQKEKEKIVEIEREISEIEGDISEEESSEEEEEPQGVLVPAEMSSQEDSSEEGSEYEQDPDIISINDTSSSDSSLKFDKNSSDTPAYQVDVEMHEKTSKSIEATFSVGTTFCVKLQKDIHADVYVEDEEVMPGSRRPRASGSRPARAHPARAPPPPPPSTEIVPLATHTESVTTDPLSSRASDNISEDSSDAEPQGIKLHFSEENIEGNMSSDEDDTDTRESGPSGKISYIITPVGFKRSRRPAASDVDETDAAPLNSKQITETENQAEDALESITITEQHEEIKTSDINNQVGILSADSEDKDESMEPVVEAPEEITVVTPEEVRVEITEIVSVENPEEVPIDTTEEVQVEISEVESVESPDAPAAEAVEIKEIVVAEQVENVKSKPSEKEESTISAEAENMAIVKTAEAKSTEHSKMGTDKTKIQDTNKLDIVKSMETENKEISKTESTPEVVVLVEKITDSEPEEVKPAARITKRTKSTSSNKSVDDQTPKRKRTQSNASNKDEEETTPENKDTPSRRRAKTPTSAEVRKIVTRRVSKETGEKLEDYKALDETLTPKRRSSRIRSKNIDDNDSVASESSVTSNKSKMSEDAGDVKPGRKGRKSVLATKTDLSVIPEVAAEETSKESSDAVEVSTGKSVSSLHKSAAGAWAGPRPASRSSRRTSAASRASVSSITSRASTAGASDDDDDTVTHAAFDVQPIDRISLLNKTDFEGTPDIEEMHDNISPESVASDASKQRRMRMGRAASESKATPKAAKIGRRISVDVAASPEAGEAGGRGRRASFTRACEALHTPKGRRTSTDIRRGEDEGTAESPAGSPAPSPARRPRRASTQSNTSTSSLTKSDTKRLKKMPPLEEEDKDSEKK